MNINFNQLQKDLIQQFDEEEGLILKSEDLSFEVRPKGEVKHQHITLRLLLFGEEFSVAYINERNSQEDVISEFYSRLHDYGTKNVKDHTIDLKIKALESHYSQLVESCKIELSQRIEGLRYEEIDLSIGDWMPERIDERGFPKLAWKVRIKDRILPSIELSHIDRTPAEHDHLAQVILELLKASG